MEATKRIWGLDLLRATAISMVVLYHFPRNADQLVLRALSHFGWAGVDLFFVLSGYLIGSQLFSMKENLKRRSLTIFYFRRFMRTLTCYYVSLALYVIFVAPPGASSWILPYLFFLQNFELPQHFSHSWSLCVEEHFYLVFPIIAFYFLKNKFERILVYTIAILLGGAILRFNLWQYFRPDQAFAISADRGFEVYLREIYYPTYTRLDGLSVGLLLAAIRVFRKDYWAKLLGNANGFLLASFITLVIAATTLLQRGSLISAIFGFPLLSIGFGFLLIAASGKSYINRIEIPGVRTLAFWSYSIYLITAVSFSFSHRIVGHYNFPPYGIISASVHIGVLMACSASLYYLVERPSLVYRDWCLKKWEVA